MLATFWAYKVLQGSFLAHTGYAVVVAHVIVLRQILGIGGHGPRRLWRTAGFPIVIGAAMAFIAYLDISADAQHVTDGLLTRPNPTGRFHTMCAVVLAIVGLFAEAHRLHRRARRQGNAATAEPGPAQG